MVMVTHCPVAVTAREADTSIINYHGHLHQNHLENTPWVKYINVGWNFAHGLICL